MRLLVHAIWEHLGKIPIDTEDNIEETFLHFDVGTPKEEIWHWIEDEYNYPVEKLLYPDKRAAKDSDYPFDNFYM